MLNQFNFNGPIVGWLNDYAPHGILTTDTHLIIRGWNRWLEQHTGRAVDSVIGAALFDVFPELVERRIDQFYRDALDGHTKVLAHAFHSYVVRLRAKPEFALPEMQQTARIAPLVDDGRVVGTITAIEDVSERVLKECELNAAREEAERANRAKDRFLAMLSHDLRTPLNSILGWAQIIRSKRLNQEMLLQGMESIERNAVVQMQLIDQILDISRIATGKLQLDIELIGVVEVIEAALDALRPMASSKGIHLEWAPPEDRRIIAGDPKRLQQIVWNLLSNALKFTPAGGSVLVMLVYGENNLQLKITDTGIGISPENIGQIFEPLWQAEQTGGEGGLGLGLAIVRELSVLHGGSIRAESAGPGQGTTFILELPWSGARSVRLDSTLRRNSHAM